MSEANATDEAIVVPKWKLVCLLKALLSHEDPDAQSKKSRKHKRPGDVAERSSRKTELSFQKPHPLGWENAPFHAMSYMARVLNVATQLTTTHRWDGNVKLFSALARQISHCPVVIWKVGAQCLSNHPDGRDDLLRSFAKTMVQVGRTAAPEILFDYSTHLISIGEYQEARRFLEDYKGKCGHNAPNDVRFILQSYRGMIEYIEWFQKKNSKDDDGDIPGNQLAAIGTETEIAVHADRAVAHFNNFADCEGNCDSFMTILIEIMEYYNRIDELEKMLQSYLQFNEIHPSPCVFMYEFLRKHYPTDMARQRYILEELARICPSHPYVLDLCKLISNQDFIKSIQHLACMVDYQEWQNDLEVWKQLTLTLTTGAINCRDKSQYYTLHTMWTDRSLWWPAYHFRLEDINVRDQSSAELAVFKSVVIATMFNTEHPYIIMVKEMLEIGKWENEMTHLIMKLEVADLLNQQMKSKLAEKCRNQSSELSSLNMTIERPLQLPTTNSRQHRRFPNPDPEMSKTLGALTLKPNPCHTWKVAKKSKKASKSNQKRTLHKIIIKRRGRPTNRYIENDLRAESSSEESSSTTSSDEDTPPQPPLATKGRECAGARNVLNKTNGTISKNPTSSHARAEVIGTSKSMVSSGDSSESEEDLPSSNTTQLNQGSANMESMSARAVVPLKRKNSTTSDKPKKQTSKIMKMLSNQDQNLSPSRNWSWRKTSNAKLNENSQKVHSDKKAGSSVTRNLVTSVGIATLAVSKDTLMHTLENNNGPLEAELNSSKDSEETEEMRHTLQWNGKSLTLHAPVKLKNLAIVLKRIDIENARSVPHVL